MAVKEKVSKIDGDKALIKTLQSVDSTQRERDEAFSELYQRHQRQVMVYFLKNTKHTEDAEDLKMQTFEKVHANISSYDDKFAFSTWMYKIALNCLIDNKRKENFEKLSIQEMKSFSGEEGEALEFQLKCDGINPEEDMLRDERIEQVKIAIDSLENQLIKELMTERFINDLTFEQIAEKFGIENNSTLRVNILRGKEILKLQLAKVNPYT
jgi:RNA polymerase sigma-70 factor (ECF subfamily)